MVLKFVFMFWTFIMLAFQVHCYRVFCGCLYSTTNVNGFRKIQHQPRCSGRDAISLFMANRDGKKNRPKTEGVSDNIGSSTHSASSSTPQQSLSQQPPPQRVNVNINIPVRQQIEWARAKKEATRITGASFRAKNVKTSYRKKLDPEREEEKKLERAKRGQEPDWDVILNATSAAPLLIVDAYNVIHQWPRLKKWMRKGETFKARNLLVQDLETLSSVKGWRIEVVFDGAGRSTTGPMDDNRGNDFDVKKVGLLDQQAKVSVTDYGVRIVYSGIGCSADSYIEKRCLDAKKVTDGKLTRSLIIASNDNMVRLAGQNAGAICMSSDRIITELKALNHIVAYKLEAAVALFNGHEVRDPKHWGTPNIYGRRTQFTIEDKRKKSKVGGDLISVPKPLGDDPESLIQHGTISDGTIPLPYGRRTQFIVVDKRKKS